MKTLQMLFFLILGLYLGAPASGAVQAPDATVDCKTISEWSADWWKWVFSISTDANPFCDTTGARATNGQPGGSVFFVAGILQKKVRHEISPLAQAVADRFIQAAPTIIDKAKAQTP